MENWRLRDMIWNFTLALKFPFIWPEYLAIVLFFLSLSSILFKVNLYLVSLLKKRNLKLYNAIDPVLENVSLQSFGHKGCKIFQPGIFQPQNFNPGLFNHNFSIMNTYFNQELFNHEYFDHELFNHEHYNPELFNHEHFNPWQLFIVKSGVEPWGSNFKRMKLQVEKWVLKMFIAENFMVQSSWFMVQRFMVQRFMVQRFMVQKSRASWNWNTYLATISKAKKTPATIETLQISDLPVKSLVKQSPGICDTIVNVKYSNLNYKDALVSSAHENNQFYETQFFVYLLFKYFYQIKL